MKQQKSLKRTGLIGLCAAAALAGIALPLAQAQVLAVSNLANTSGADKILHATWATSFTTGGAAQTFQSFTVPLSRQVGAVSLDFVTAVLYSDASGQPGTGLDVLGPVTVPLGTTENLYTFTSFAPPTLAANTTYWLALKTVAAGLESSIWSGTQDLSQTSALGWTIGDTKQSFNGTTWVATGFPEAFRFEVAVVPEPSTYALIAGLGLVGFAGLRRWRQRA